MTADAGVDRERAALLLGRLDAIGRSLAADGRAQALLALGSVGQETARLDRYSDLDFFALVDPGHQRAFVEDLGWLAAARPIAWAYRNTADGWKVLFDDGVVAEMAVFEAAQLAGIPFAPGRLVWARAGFDATTCAPRHLPDPTPPDRHWLVGEALTCLHGGLSRWLRGERLAAMRMVQGHALDKVVRLVDQIEPPAPAVGADPFAPERRLERRHPSLDLAPLARGYLETPASARALLDWLAAHVALPEPMRHAIEQLLAEAAPTTPPPAGTTSAG